MTEAQIYEQLTELFREIFSDDDIILKPETTAADIDGWDSFNHISIIVSVETRFGIKMETREIEGLNNIGTLVAIILKKLAK
jgi:acyl carrier protein